MGIFVTISQRFDRQSALFGRMREKFQLDEINPEYMGTVFVAQTAQAARSCSFCRHADECQAWLDAADGEARDAAPAFCPNRAFFAAHRH